MSDADVISGPWRATRLWNEIVRSFHSGMPCKRHRVRMKTVVENCFSGAEAVDWLHKSLKKNPNFGQDVTKEQTVQLLQKILRAGIVECVHSTSSGSQNSLFGMGSTGSEGAFVTADLYRFVDSAAENLRTPGKNKSPVASRISSRREALAAMDNTPLRRNGGGGGTRSTSEESRFRETADSEWDTKSETSGLKKHRRRSMMAAMDCPVVPTPAAAGPTDSDSDKRSYFQSLPPNSLMILDNDQTWREAFESQLGSALSAVHVRNLDINVSRIIYNMTKVSSKGVVQLMPPSRQSDQDLPHWVLSAMKCLANWPKPMRMINGEDSSLPNYPGFIRDVFDVVKDYFLGLGAPLIPFDLFDMFESAYVKAESVKARSVPLPSLVPVSSEYQRYLGTDLDGVAVAATSPQLQTSTPTLHEQQSNRHHQHPHPQRTIHHPKFYMMRNDSSNAFLNLDGERVARVRPTQEVMPPQMSNGSRTSSLHQGSTFDSTGNTTTSASLTLNADMSATAIMRNFLPPNTCFETVFMNEVPVTRIVPQKQNDTLHLTTRPASRCHSRASTYAPIQTAWDTRSIATQTSQEEEQQQQQQTRSRQPRWRRSSRLRKSIAVMDPRPTNSCQPQPPVRSASANEISPILTPNPAMSRTRSSSCCRGGDYGVSSNPEGGGGGNMSKAFSSVDNLLEPAASEEDARFLKKYQRMSLCSARDSQGSLLERDNVILSKAVRKEKRRQREKRESGVGCKDKVYAEIKPGPSSSEYSPNSTSSSSNYGPYSRRAPSVRYASSRFNHLTVKTPLNPVDFPADMQYVRAEPYRQDGDDAASGANGGGARQLSAEGIRSAVDSFKLLGLLLRPASRRKLQLLLKFMKRVSGNDQLTLRRDANNFILVLDMFVRIIIRPEVPAANYDGDISRKIVEFFIKNYEAIWTPPESLRREVEDKVYQSLVSKRIRAGEDPFPVTFCRQITSTAYETDKREGGTRAALLDLLDHILSSEKLSEKEKKKKLKKFKASYPEIYRTKFPNAEDEPDCMQLASTGNTSALARLPSLSRLKSVIRI